MNCIMIICYTVLVIGTEMNEMILQFFTCAAIALIIGIIAIIYILKLYNPH